MAVGLTALPTLHPVAGIRLGTTAAGIKKPGRPDLVVITIAPETQAAALFTRNRFFAAPVGVARSHLARSRPRALLINTGYANAGTGADGERDARECVEALAKLLDCRPNEVLPFSTGIVGERLPIDRVVAALPQCLAQLDANGWAEAAAGIMTTDTVAKGSSRRIMLGSRTITITGIAKGSGMIRPDMATMLAFVATDATASEEVLRHCIRVAADKSFNRITVDGDTSTNDACVLLATGRYGGAMIDNLRSESYRALERGVIEVFADLAQAIVRDGEGATKLVTIEVEQGASESDCLEVAYAVAHSPLVKTAFFASDPNWGRILAAVGRAKVAQLDVGRVSIYLDDVCVVQNGGIAPEYSEARGKDVMRNAEILVRIVLGSGAACARVWTCDLSHGYVSINADYRS